MGVSSRATPPAIYLITTVSIFIEAVCGERLDVLLKCWMVNDLPTPLGGMLEVVGGLVCGSIGGSAGAISHVKG